MGLARFPENIPGNHRSPRGAALEQKQELGHVAQALDVPGGRFQLVTSEGAIVDGYEFKIHT